MNPNDSSAPSPAPHTAHVFLCPSCECTLDHIGNRTEPIAGDVVEVFSCPSGCGSFEHERRTHRLRFVDGSAQSPRK